MNLVRSPRNLQFCIFLVVTALVAPSVDGREWTDKSGRYHVSGTLVAFDEVDITIKLDAKNQGRELLAIPIEQLSEADRAYLNSEEMRLEMKSNDAKQVWTLRNGLKVIARVVDYAKKDVVIQRRRGKVFVNEQLLESLPEVYQRMVPKIVEHFENKPMPDDKAFNNWVKQQGANARTFTCEGVILEFPSGQEYGFPFFLFSDADRRLLEPQWKQWQAASSASDMEAAKQAEEQRQHSLYLQSQAAMYQQNQQYQQQQMQMARLQLQLSAVQAGVTDAWEVWLEPGPGVRGYPINVAVFARDSEAAAFEALRRNPGYVVGPIRKLAGY